MQYNQNIYVHHVPTPMEWWPLLLLLGVLGGLGWVIVAAGSVIEKGDAMDRSERIAQLYGYTVCLIAIVVFIASTNSFVQNAFTYANPLGANPWTYNPAGHVLSSFEAYKATYDATLPGEKAPPKISDSEMHARYDALRAEQVSTAQFEAAKSMTVSAILIVIATTLFALHWRWLRARATA